MSWRSEFRRKDRAALRGRLESCHNIRHEYIHSGAISQFFCFLDQFFDLGIPKNLDLRERMGSLRKKRAYLSVVILGLKIRDEKKWAQAGTMDRTSHSASNQAEGRGSENPSSFSGTSSDWF